MYKYLKYKTKYLNLKYGIQNGGNSNIHHISLKNPWIKYIKKNLKKFEGRLNKGLFKKINIGDKIVFYNKKMKIETYVINKYNYNTFKDMIEDLGLNNLLPNIETIDEGVKIYHQYYTKEDENKYGVVGLELSLDEPIIHESKLQSPYYEYIKDGKKIYETRVFDDKRKKMNKGDIWIFKHNIDDKKPLKTIITDIKIYKSFREAIEDTGVNKLLPQLKEDDIEKGIEIYENFDNGNYKIDGEKYGVVRFTIKLI